MVASKQSSKAAKPRDATLATPSSKKRPRVAKKTSDAKAAKVAKATAAAKPDRKRAKKVKPVVASPEGVEDDSLALVTVPQPKAGRCFMAEPDDADSVGQYTRGKRYLDAIAQQELAKLVASGEITEEQAGKIRLSKVWIQLMRRIAEKLMEDLYKLLAMICRVTGRKTVDLQVLHTLRFVQSQTNSNLVKYTKQSHEQVSHSILEDFPELAEAETRTAEHYAALQRSLHVNCSTYDDLAVDEAISRIQGALLAGGSVTASCPIPQ